MIFMLDMILKIMFNMHVTFNFFQMLKPYLRYTFQLIWRQRRKFFFLAGLVLIDAALRLIQPFFFKLIVDTLSDGLVKNIFTSGQLQLMFQVIGMWFVMAVIGNVVNAQNHFLVWNIGSGCSEVVHMDGYQRLLKLDYHQHTQKHSSQYAKIVDEADTSIWEMTNWWLGRFFPAFVGFAGMLAIAFVMSWQMTLVSLTVIPPGLAIIIFMIKRYEDRQHQVNKLWNLKHEHLSDQVSNIITYKLNQNEKLFTEVQKGYSDRAAKAQTDLNRKWRITEMLNPDSIARFLVMGMGVFLVKDGKITLGTLFMFMALLTEILVPLHLLGDILPQYSRRARHIDKLLKLLDEKDIVVDLRKPKKLGRVFGKIEFQDVHFGYPGSDEKAFQIRGISFAIEPGQTVALVGHSGSGKSTIMSLLTRLNDPTSGEILMDGVNIKKYAQEAYRALAGTVLQEHSMYNETIAQNISYGKPGASKKEILAAAKCAAADQFIDRLPQRYDTLIGERGVRLSGGEKQRLAIARAILKNPRIVVLDEPTSALDSITEAKVQRGLDTLTVGRTCLVIAHRLSTVRNADKIIILKEGKIEAMGTHSELLHTCPDYREMVELQTGGFLADE